MLVAINCHEKESRCMENGRSSVCKQYTLADNDEMVKEKGENNMQGDELG